MVAALPAFLARGVSSALFSRVAMSPAVAVIGDLGVSPAVAKIGASVAVASFKAGAQVKGGGGDRLSLFGRARVL